VAAALLRSVAGVSSAIWRPVVLSKTGGRFNLPRRLAVRFGRAAKPGMAPLPVPPETSGRVAAGSRFHV